MTSSYATVGYSVKPGGHYDESDWTCTDDELAPYIKSKVVAERAVVDVRDVVDLHLRAMLDPAAAGERFIGAAGPSISFFEMGRRLARHRPEFAGRMPQTELTNEQVREAAPTDPRRCARPRASGGKFP